MPSVNSTNIAAVEFNDTTQTMTVDFLSGGRYEYYGVPREIYYEVINAPSVGSAFYQLVRNRYTFQRLN
jgi:hypothetical protein